MKNLFLGLILVISSLASFTVFADHPVQVGKPVVETALVLMAQNVPVIDVRQEACTAGYVKGAHLISIEKFVNDSERAVADVLKLVGNDKTKDVAIYCRSGARAGKVVEILKNLGFTKLHNLGGLGDYFDAATMQHCEL